MNDQKTKIPPLTQQQMVYALKENEPLTFEAIRTLMNGDPLQITLPTLTRIVNAALADMSDKSSCQAGEQEPVAWQHQQPIVDNTGNCVGYSEWCDGKGLSWWPTRALYTRPQPADDKLSNVLQLTLTALECSEPTHSHYPEPVKRHADAITAIRLLLTEPN